MDLNLVRSVITVLAFGAFVGIVWFALRPRSQRGFAEAAQLPFADSAPAARQPGDRA